MDTSNSNAATNARGSSNSPLPAVNVAAGCGGFSGCVCVVIVGVLGCGFVGLIPPWPVLSVLAIGCVATVVLVGFNRPKIAGVVAASTILGASWLLLPVVEVRSAEPSDRIYGDYFGIDRDDKAVGDLKIKNIVIATGTFTLGTWISASLYHVNAGNVQELNSFTVGRSPNQIGAPVWVDLQNTFALGSRSHSNGRVTQLGSAGQSRGGGRGGEAVNDVLATASASLPSRLTSGTKKIVYVEGDAGFIIDRSATVDLFAKQNKGNYLVVEMELH